MPKPELNNGTEDRYEITDDDCLQCCKKTGERSYHLVQINGYPDKSYHISTSTIDLDDYDMEEKTGYLKLYGYDNMKSFLEQNTAGRDVQWGILAEMVFETHAMETEDPTRHDGWNEAVSEMERITGLDLKTFITAANDQKGEHDNV